jgi:hypothetical protein
LCIAAPIYLWIASNMLPATLCYCTRANVSNKENIRFLAKPRQNAEATVET